ncbi:hypothetical protein D1224_08790 [Henriciella barbarensis]|uniref:DUF1579 domain-containing protein n=1 Tax=Henriciella barbarensis TaxID=86342 RepID=A0A399R3M8_9PROT|nr:hypothetical protein [Henriciella barbarensis]RIJ24322.1 hypothetical protein D1224_08790 [Henriciella barbarensis]
MRTFIGLVATGALAACVQMPWREKAPALPAVQPGDLAMLEGSWAGSLTYRDYSPPHEDVSIPATLTVDKLDEGMRLELKYPDEPSAYDRSMLIASDEGRTLNSEMVLSRTQSDDEVTIVTASECEDDGRPAQCEVTYTLSPKVFEMTKMVALESGEAPFRRNAYAFVRTAKPD